VIEPRQGNCHAINAAFETALQMFPDATSLLMIDDDEIASPDWLEQMVRTAHATGADIVGGPVFPRIRRRTEARLAPPPRVCAGLRGLRPGAGDLWLRQLPDPALGVRPAWACRRSTSVSIFWAVGTPISSTLPKARFALSLGQRSQRSARPCRKGRTSLKWLVMRGLRIGAINYHVQRKATPTAWLRTKLTLKLLAALPLSLVYAVCALLSERKGPLPCIR
jgi:hypothetical protein